MKYQVVNHQVGCTNAVAGYVKLYYELSQLPVVFTIDEACDNKKKGFASEILADMLSATKLFSVMGSTQGQ
jgi:hypothetical protein